VKTSIFHAVELIEEGLHHANSCLCDCSSWCNFICINRGSWGMVLEAYHLH